MEEKKCSFCGKNENEVEFLFQAKSDSSVYICEECISVYVKFMETMNGHECNCEDCCGKGCGENN